MGECCAMFRIMECSICSKLKRENLVLLGKNICSDCEEKMVKATVEDILYPMYMEKVKDILKASEV
jgi:hypothetical protein